MIRSHATGIRIILVSLCSINPGSKYILKPKKSQTFFDVEIYTMILKADDVARTDLLLVRKILPYFIENTETPQSQNL